MKKLLIIAAVLVSLPAAGASAGENDSGPASLGALNLRGSFDWAGPYVGVHGGFHWARPDADLSNVVGPTLTLDVNNGVFPRSTELSDESFTGGLHAGWQFQRGMWVAGVEGDISWLGQEAKRDISVIDPVPPPSPFSGALVNTTFKSEIDWLATMRLRGGVAFDTRTLAYLTGGVAVGEVRNAMTVTIPSLGYAPPTWSETGTRWGWVVGAGIEHAFTPRLTARLEYLHFDLEDQKVLATDPVNFPGESLEYRYENNGDIVRVGANWRF